MPLDLQFISISLRKESDSRDQGRAHTCKGLAENLRLIKSCNYLVCVQKCVAEGPITHCNIIKFSMKFEIQNL